MRNIFANINHRYQKNTDKQQGKICVKIKTFITFANAIKMHKINKIDKYKNLKPHRLIQFYLIDLIWFMNTVIVYTSGRISY